jgi:hypothetical protein
MTHPAENHDDVAVEEDHDDVADQDGADGHGDPEELPDPDEEAVRRLQAGPVSPEGKEEVAAAGVNTPH